MLTHAIHRAFDTAILLSGDKDYLETVRAVKNQGLRVEIVSFRHSLAADLAAESSASILFWTTYGRRSSSHIRTRKQRSLSQLTNDT